MELRTLPRSETDLSVMVGILSDNGRCAWQSARVLSANRTGAHLDWVRNVRLGQTIEVEHHKQKASFRVVWMGAPKSQEEGQVRVVNLDPLHDIWSTEPGPEEHPTEIKSVTVELSWNGQERRMNPRYRCAGGAEVREAGAGAWFIATVSDVSAGGCYLETPTPLPVDTQADLILRVNEFEVHTQGRVRIVHPRMGMGMEFLERREEVLAQFQKILESVGAPRTFAGPQPSSAPAPKITNALPILLELLQKKGVLSSGDVDYVLKRAALQD